MSPLPPRRTWDQRLARQRAEAPAVRSHVREHSPDAPHDGCRYCDLRASRPVVQDERAAG